MNQAINTVCLSGYLGADPEVKVLKSGKSATAFSMATNQVYHNKGGKPEKDTQWHRICAYGSVAEACRNLKKGTWVFVQGRLRTRTYNDSGDRRFITEVVVNFLVSGSQAHKKNHEDETHAGLPFWAGEGSA